MIWNLLLGGEWSASAIRLRLASPKIRGLPGVAPLRIQNSLCRNTRRQQSPSQAFIQRHDVQPPGSAELPMMQMPKQGESSPKDGGFCSNTTSQSSGVYVWMGVSRPAVDSFNPV
jgi:hypothetical protein